MTIKEILDLIGTNSGTIILLAIVLLSLIQITPIKINPWSSIANWLGKQLNKDIIKRIEDIETKLDGHIEETEQRDIREIRTTILNFANSCMNHRKHTKEEFDFIINECDKYEKYCADNNIVNGVAAAAMTEIKNIYAKCLHENSFLKSDN